MGVSRQKQTICFWETMWTEANSHLRPFAFFLPIKSNTLKTSFCFEGIMNVQALTEFMAFMMNARDDTTLNFGRLSLTALTVYPSLQ